MSAGHPEVAASLLQFVDAATGADWSTKEHLKRFAAALQTRTYNLGHHAYCFRERAADFRKMAMDEKLGVDRMPERATAKLYDDVAALFEKHATDVVCGELCGFVHDGKESWGMTKREPCTCARHRGNGEKGREG